MKKIELTLPYPPPVNHLWRNYNGRMVKSAQGRQYAKDVAQIACGVCDEPLETPVCISIDFYRPRKAGDLDNLLKATLDSLTGIAYVDDKQIVRITANRYDDKTNPRAVVTITERID